MYTNPIKDKNGAIVNLGDKIRYYDSTGMWIESIIIDAGSALAIQTPENPILLYEFVSDYVYDGSPIQELEVIKAEHVCYQCAGQGTVLVSPEGIHPRVAKVRNLLTRETCNCCKGTGKCNS